MTHLAGGQSVLQVPESNVRLLVVLAGSHEASGGIGTPSQRAASHTARGIAEGQRGSLSTKIPNNSHAVVAGSGKNL